MKEIQNIIFDLGNVLLDLDFNRVNETFQKLLGSDFSNLATSETTKEIFIQFEKGYYSEESFINALQRQATRVPSGREIISAWNSLLVEIPVERLEMLEQLREKGYQLYLLSNTNSLHLDWLRRYMQKTYSIESFDDQFFVKSYYSHLLNMRKPDREIYEFILNDAFITASETLFIDDNEANIIGAQALGLSTIYHNSGLDISEVMKGF